MNNNTIPAHLIQQHQQQHNNNNNKIATPQSDSNSRTQFDATLTNDAAAASYTGSSARSRIGTNNTQDYKSNSTNSFKNNNVQITTPTTTSVATTNNTSHIGQLTSRCWRGLKPSTAACVTILILTTTCSLCSASLCEPQSWWDSYKDKCIPCTVCQGDMLPLRPCEMHRDTVCGSIYDLKIDWVVLSKTEPNWKEVRQIHILK